MLNKELRTIKNQLEDIAEKEAMKLFRLGRKAREHGCSQELISAIRNEALELHDTAYPERLLDEFKIWKFAFR